MMQCHKLLLTVIILSLGWISASHTAQQVAYYRYNLLGSAIAATNGQY